MFCLNYYPFENSYLKDADQLRIKYRPADRTLEEFLKAYSDKSIVIDVADSFTEVDADLFKALYEKYKNIKLIVDFYNEEYRQRVLDCGVPFFFSNYATTIDQVHGFMKYHPSDMYICEELGFSLNKISKLLHDNNILVRVFPNICQSSFRETESIKTFFIRPEDIPSYAKFVDIFELVSDMERQVVLLKVYKQEKWFGQISELIPTFHDSLDSKHLLNNFGIIRSSCGKRCMYDPNCCKICDRYVEFSKTLQEKHIVVRKLDN